jgi:hypothetical protein
MTVGVGASSQSDGRQQRNAWRAGGKGNYSSSPATFWDIHASIVVNLIQSSWSLIMFAEKKSLTWPT